MCSIHLFVSKQNTAQLNKKHFKQPNIGLFRRYIIGILSDFYLCCVRNEAPAHISVREFINYLAAVKCAIFESGSYFFWVGINKT